MFFMPLAQMLQEMRATIRAEFNFLREAHVMRAIAARLKGDGVGIVIPEPLFALSSPHLLVMQRMSGHLNVLSDSATMLLGSNEIILNECDWCAKLVHTLTR